MRFPYRDVGWRDRPGEPPLLRPYVVVRGIGLSNHLPTVGLLDTGADITTLSLEFIEALNVYIKPGDEEVVTGADGEPFSVVFGTIDIELTAKQRSIVHRWHARVAFSERPMGAGILLGNAGFLEYFSVHFHGLERHVSLKPRKPFPPAVMLVKTVRCRPLPSTRARGSGPLPADPERRICGSPHSCRADGVQKCIGRNTRGRPNARAC